MTTPARRPLTEAEIDDFIRASEAYANALMVRTINRARTTAASTCQPCTANCDQGRRCPAPRDPATPAARTPAELRTAVELDASLSGLPSRGVTALLVGGAALLTLLLSFASQQGWFQ